METISNMPMRQLLSVGKKNWGGLHYCNSGEHWWQSAVDIIISFILDDPTATAASKLWLIKATEPFNCARYSEEHRVIQRHSHSKANLKTCEWKKRHRMWYSLIFCSPFGWDMTFRALTLLLNIPSILQCKRTQKKIYQTPPPRPASCSIHPIYYCSVLLHPELHEGSGLHLSFPNNAVLRGGKPEPAKGATILWTASDTQFTAWFIG